MILYRFKIAKIQNNQHFSFNSQFFISFCQPYQKKAYLCPIIWN